MSSSRVGQLRWHGGACVTTERSFDSLPVAAASPPASGRRRPPAVAAVSRAPPVSVSRPATNGVSASPSSRRFPMTRTDVAAAPAAPATFQDLAKKLQAMGAQQAAQRLQAVTQERRRLGEQVHVRGHFGAQSRTNVIQPFTFSHAVKTPNGQVVAVVSKAASLAQPQRRQRLVRPVTVHQQPVHPPQQQQPPAVSKLQPSPAPRRCRQPAAAAATGVSPASYTKRRNRDAVPSDADEDDSFFAPPHNGGDTSPPDRAAGDAPSPPASAADPPRPAPQQHSSSGAHPSIITKRDLLLSASFSSQQQHLMMVSELCTDDTPRPPARSMSPSPGRAASPQRAVSPGGRRVLPSLPLQQRASPVSESASARRLSPGRRILETASRPSPSSSAAATRASPVPRSQRLRQLAVGTLSAPPVDPDGDAVSPPLRDGKRLGSARAVSVEHAASTVNKRRLILHSSSSTKMLQNNTLTDFTAHPRPHRPRVLSTGGAFYSAAAGSRTGRQPPSSLSSDDWDAAPSQGNSETRSIGQRLIRVRL
eukprot:Gregarina_sp_Pseudo_9__3353@NODE_352_length_3084_cov_9_107389_g331_i0_p1_GENE_NODE_352_length_3084_cov_9_107389_g331_i0NODE_352_length_3084_cov_9_107389_g331_i0_p1_ORF_typecomplete_len593_score208_33_NODE_352_length_3084_cov_9_107389_g331_i013042908